MLEAERVPRHTPPSREGVMLSASLGRRQLNRARPRSAVTVSHDSPGLAPLTGFSRSSGRSRYSLRSAAGPNRRFARVGCRGLEADGRICCEARQHALHTAPPNRSGRRGLFMPDDGAYGLGRRRVARFGRRSVDRWWTTEESCG